MARITSPFGYRTEALDVVADVDLSAQTAIVTGAASGIGVETARALASAGADVVLAVRDEARGLIARDEILATHPEADIEVHTLDLANLRSVRSFATWFNDEHGELDILVNNAAVMATPFQFTEDGFELQIGTNHLGHFALFRALLPALKESGHARVVALSSIGHRRSDVDLDDLNFERRDYEKWIAYGQSKTACSLFAVGVTEHHRRDGILANAVHPGGIMTGLQKHLEDSEVQGFGWVNERGDVNEAFKTPSQGASTSVWAAVGPELDGIGGLYLEDCAQAQPFDESFPFAGVRDYAIDPERAAMLWDLSLELVGR